MEVQAGEVCSKDNMFITNQSEFKTTVSALRRELKKAFPDVPSHAAMQELFAKALGASSFAELQAKLPKEPAASESKPAAVASRYPLSNLDGRFDLVAKGKHGVAVSGKDFSPMQGTLETIHASTAYVDYATRTGPGEFKIEYGGETQVNWDGQATDKDEAGHILWVAEEWDVVSSGRIVLVPEDFRTHDLDLPVRKALVYEYDRYVRENALMDKLGADLLKKGYDCDTLSEMAGVIGFALTEVELIWLEEALKTQHGLPALKTAD